MQAKRGKPTYNTLNARMLLQAHVPAHLREEEPAAPPEPEAATKGLNALRNVTRILQGKAPKADPVVAVRAESTDTEQTVNRLVARMGTP